MTMFSVIIPTFGRPVLLQEAIDSVLSQSAGPLEVIVVDDGSKRPVEVRNHPQVQLLRMAQNRGAAHARNVGVEAANGEVLAFLDDDDTWSADRLKFALTALERAPIAVCWQNPRRGRLLEGDVHDSILDATTPNLGATCVIRSRWVPMDPTYRTCEDLVWWLNISQGCRVATHPKHGLRVRRHGEVRVKHGIEQRILDSHRFMHEYSDYFSRHRKAAAFRWKRIGLMNASLGRQPAARDAFWRSLAKRPTLATTGHFVRAVGRGVRDRWRS